MLERQVGLAMHVRSTRSLVVLGLQRSQHVSAVQDTTATLHQVQAHALRARLAGTRVCSKMVLRRPLCATRALRTRLLLALGLQRSHHVCAV